MQPSELAFYTTRELVKELIQRKTFLGVIVHSAEEARGTPWVGERIFQVHHNSNLDAEEASRLLDVVADSMSRQND